MSKNKRYTTTEQSHKKRHKILSMILMALLMISLLTVTCFAEDTNVGGSDMWTKATEIMQDVYGKIVGISTIAAVVTAAIALLLMNFSKNGKTVDESRAWLKRIIISWVILNGLGFIMAYVSPLMAGGTYTP
jgi:ABC-type Na+ efflux pump permease subunit